MLSNEVEIVDGAWGDIGMSQPEYLAWKRIKKFLAEVQKSSHNTARNEIAVDVLRGIMARTLFCAESQSKIVSEFQRQLSSVA